MTRVLAGTVLLTLLAGGSIIYVSRNDSTEAAKLPQSGSSSKIILEVINRHFTVGEKIRSVYLRVSSDGTAECHTEKYWDEPDVVKKRVLAPEDFEKLKALLAQPELLSFRHRYELMYQVIDSWMEWKIKVFHPGGIQAIEVAGFSPAAAKKRNQPYPDELVKLGCSIWKLRSEVYGDEEAARAFQDEGCHSVLTVQ